VRALAISTDKRVPQLPDLPTIAEAGLPGYAAISWQMVTAPAGTPRPLLDRMAAPLSQLTPDPPFRPPPAQRGNPPPRAPPTPASRASDAGQGAEPAGGTVDEARAFVKQETVKWREV